MVSRLVVDVVKASEDQLDLRVELSVQWWENRGFRLISDRKGPDEVAIIRDGKIVNGRYEPGQGAMEAVDVVLVFEKVQGGIPKKKGGG